MPGVGTVPLPTATDMRNVNRISTILRSPGPQNVQAGNPFADIARQAVADQLAGRPLGGPAPVLPLTPDPNPVPIQFEATVTPQQATVNTMQAFERGQSDALARQNLEAFRRQQAAERSIDQATLEEFMRETGVTDPQQAVRALGYLRANASTIGPQPEEGIGAGIVRRAGIVGGAAFNALPVVGRTPMSAQVRDDLGRPLDDSFAEQLPNVTGEILGSLALAGAGGVASAGSAAPALVRQMLPAMVAGVVGVGESTQQGFDTASALGATDTEATAAAVGTALVDQAFNALGVRATIAPAIERALKDEATGMVRSFLLRKAGQAAEGAVIGAANEVGRTAVMANVTGNPDALDGLGGRAAMQAGLMGAAVPIAGLPFDAAGMARTVADRAAARQAAADRAQAEAFRQAGGEISRAMQTQRPETIPVTPTERSAEAAGGLGPVQVAPVPDATMPQRRRVDPTILPTPGERSAPAPEAATTWTHRTTAAGEAGIVGGGFRASESGELGPGVYVIDDPRGLGGRFAADGMRDLQVSVGGRMLDIPSSANMPLAALRAMYGRDAGTARYDQLNRSRQMFRENGLPNWKLLQEEAKALGYVGFIRQTDTGNRDAVVFDPANAVLVRQQAETPNRQVPLDSSTATEPASGQGTLDNSAGTVAGMAPPDGAGPQPPSPNPPQGPDGIAERTRRDIARAAAMTFDEYAAAVSDGGETDAGMVEQSMRLEDAPPRASGARPVASVGRVAIEPSGKPRGATKDYRGVVAVDGDRVVGYASFDGYQVSLVVDPEYQGQGVGAELSYQLRRDDPFIPSGGLSDGGRRTLRQTWLRFREDAKRFEVPAPSEAGRNRAGEPTRGAPAEPQSPPRGDRSISPVLDSGERVVPVGDSGGAAQDVVGGATRPGEAAGATDRGPGTGADRVVRSPDDTARSMIEAARQAGLEDGREGRPPDLAPDVDPAVRRVYRQAYRQGQGEARRTPVPPGEAPRARASEPDADTLPTPTPDVLERLNAREAELLRQLKAPAQRPAGAGRRGMRGGQTTLIPDLVTVAQIAAIRVAKAGVKSYRAVSRVVRQALAERDPGQPVDADVARSVSRAVRRALANAGKSPDAIEQAVASLANADNLGVRSLRERIARTTGTERSAPVTVDAGTALRQSLRREARAANAAAREARSKAIDEMTAKIEQFQEKALNIRLRAEQRASAQGFRAGRDEARAEAQQQRADLTQRLNEQADARAQRVQDQSLRVRLRAEERAADRGYRVGQDDARQVARRVAGIVRQFAPPELTKRFLKAIANARKEGDADAIIGRVLADVAVYRQKKAVAMARAEIKGAKPRKMVAELRAEIKDSQRELDGILEALTARTTVIDNQMARTRARLAGAENAQERARLLADLQGDRVAVINEARSDIMRVVERVRQAKAAQRHYETVLAGEKAYRREVVVDELVSNIEKRHPIIRDTSRIPGNPQTPRLSRVWMLGDNRDTTAAILGDGVFGDIFVRDILAGERQMMDKQARGEDAVRAALERSGFQWGSVEARQLSATAEGQRAELRSMTLPSGVRLTDWTPAEMMALYATITDADARAKIINGTPIVLDRTEFTTRGDQPITLTRADLVALDRLMDPKLKRVVDDLKAHFEQVHAPDDRAAYREHFGRDMVTWPGYFRTKRRGGGNDQPPQMLGDWSQSGPRSMSQTSMWKDRVENAGKAPYLIGDFFHVYSQMVRDTAARAHLNKPVRSLHAVLRDPRVQRTVRQRMGEQFYKNLTRAAEDSAVILRSNRLPESWVGRAVMKVGRNVSRSLLSLNPSSIMQNVGGIARVAVYIPEEYWAAGLADLASPKVFREMVDNAPWLRNRHQRDASVAASAMLGETSDVLGPLSVGDAAKRLARPSLQTTSDIGQLFDRIPAYAWGDSRPSVFAWAALKAQAAKEMPTATEAQRMRWVADRATELIQQTQNPHTTIGMSNLQATLRGTPMGVLIQFTSDGIQQMNMLRSAYFRHGAKSPEFRRAAVAVAANTVWSNQVKWFFRSGAATLMAQVTGNADDEQYRKGRRDWADLMVRESLATGAGLFYGGSQLYELAEALYDNMAGNAPRTADAAITPAGSVLANAITSLMNAARMVSTDTENMDEQQLADFAERQMKAYERAGKATAILAGIPLVPPTNFVQRVWQGATAPADPAEAMKGARKAMEGDNDDRAAEAVYLVLRQQTTPEGLKRASQSAASSLRAAGPQGRMSDERFGRWLQTRPAGERAGLIQERQAWRARAERIVGEAVRKARGTQGATP